MDFQELEARKYSKIVDEKLRGTVNNRITTETTIEKWKEIWSDAGNGRYSFASLSADKMDNPIGNGMLIHGGKTLVSNQYVYLDNMFWFNLETKQWALINQGTNIPKKRAEHTMSFYKDKTCIFGGQVVSSGPSVTVPSNELLCYDFNETGDQKWATLDDGSVDDSDHPSKRSNHAMVTYNDSFIIFGGLDINDEPLNDVWEYDLINNKWLRWTFDNGAKIPVGRFSFGYSLIEDASNGSFMAIFGGGVSNSASESSIRGDLWLLDLESKDWQNVPYDGPQFTRVYHGMTSVGTKLMLLSGFTRVEYNQLVQGFVFNHLLSIDLKDVIEGTPESGNPRWYIAPDISNNSLYRMRHEMIATSDGELLTYGGVFETVYSDMWSVDSTKLELRPTESSDFIEEPLVLTFAMVVGIIIFSAVFIFGLAFILVRFCDRTYQQSSSVGVDGAATTPQEGIALAVFNKLPKIKHNGETNNQDSCVICLEVYKEEELLTQLPCNHNFHTKCIGEWLEEHMECPMCKRRADSTAITPGPPQQAAI
eukprot:TRINITY_DN10149_c0_g1_i1.p1 TRINITY_DN10149_c0_g1~~TRINITY_DN10149_c0_g1_i1.p1  ORF type:complete len:536 (-),score=118.49 TRINITY_DN10149_c0_g1_i1:341-1948(-)